MPAILVVDDEPLQRDILKTILTDEGFETYAASSGPEALKVTRAYNPEIVLTDLKMKGMDGVELLEKLKQFTPEPTVIMMTAFGTIGSAVEAMKKGAFDYLTKPLDKDVVILAIKRALERTELLRTNRELHQALCDRARDGIIGNSKAINDVISLVKKIAGTPATVLILGESGTGKELIAKAIHYNSPRGPKSFTAINCAAIPETLLESELFGYEPGAFTGATSRKTGLFEAADGGTLFLDEVGDLPPLTQSKILRVLQEKEVRRIGGRDAGKVDVRIIAATNKDLEVAMREGRFREDLYYRLKVVTITLPPLRERRGDIGALTKHFIEKFNKEFGKNVNGIDPRAMRALMEYDWPGNIRQLESVIEKAILMCESETISLRDVEGEILEPQQMEMNIEIPEEGIVFADLEKELLKKAMAKADNVVAKAARLLGMNYDSFWHSWRKLGLNGSPAVKEPSPCPFDLEIPDRGISLEEVEKDLLVKAMKKANNVGSRAAKLLGMSYRSFSNRWEKHGFEHWKDNHK